MKLPTNFSIKSLKQLAFVQWFNKFTSSSMYINFCVKGFLSIILLIFTFIPVWLYLGARWLVEPADFWQELAVLAVACIVVGWAQVFMCIIGGALWIALIIEDI